MPVQLDIRENGRVLCYTYTDPWTAEQVLELRSRNWEHRNACDFTVHVLINLIGTRVFPPKVVSLRHGSPDLEHSRSGQVVIVGASDLVHSLVEIVATLSQARKFKFVSTEAEAWSYLRNYLND